MLIRPVAFVAVCLSFSASARAAVDAALEVGPAEGIAAYLYAFSCEDGEWIADKSVVLVETAFRQGDDYWIGDSDTRGRAFER